MANTRTRRAPGAQRGSGRASVLDQLADEINKEYGEGSAVNAMDAFRFMRQIPLGHLVGDLSLLGGLPEGQASMFLGREGGGKTTQAMRCVAQMHLKYPDKIALWVDSEETFDPLWAQQHGVDMDRLKLLRIKAGEDVTDTMKIAKANAPELGMTVLDSVNQTVPLKEYEESAGDTQVMLHPRMMGRMVSALITASKDRRAKGFDPVTEVFINQYRSKIGGPPGFGDKHIPGGNQLRYYCSTHLEFRAKILMGKADEDSDGIEAPRVIEHIFSAKRTKMPSSLRSGEYHVVVSPDHRLPIGSYDEAATIVSQAKKIGLWTGAGRNQQFEGIDRVFPNMDAGKRWLELNPDEATRIKQRIIAHRRTRVGMPAIPPDGYLLFRS